MKRYDVISMVAFVSFMLGPLVSLALYGYSDQAESPPKWKDIDIRELIGPNDAYRTTLARKALSDTPLGMLAVTTKSTIDYDLLGFAETDQVISGKNRWLFYKPSFNGGTCVSERFFSEALN